MKWPDAQKQRKIHWSDLLLLGIGSIPLIIGSTRPSYAGTKIRGEFEYDVDSRKIEAWQIGPLFQLNNQFELEIPIGQSEGEWFSQPEFTYTLDLEDVTVDFSLGVESFFRARRSQDLEDQSQSNHQEQQFIPFGKVELEVQF